MSGIFQKLLEIGSTIGTVDNAHLYEDFINIEGVSTEGKKFSITLHIKEEKEDGN